MKKVFAMMRQKFANLNLNDENVEQFKDRWFISIYGSMEESPFFKRSHENVLILQVDDIDREYTVSSNADGNFLVVKDNDNLIDAGNKNQQKLILFSKDHAKQVVEFFKKIGDNFSLIVHCSAGVSRSGAIAEFARLFFNLDYEEFKRDNPQILPNRHIVKMLNQYFLDGD